MVSSCRSASGGKSGAKPWSIISWRAAATRSKLSWVIKPEGSTEACAPSEALKRSVGRRKRPTPHAFWHAKHHPWIVGQDCILRAGFQPVLVLLFTGDSGGLQTRRRLQTCPTETQSLAGQRGTDAFVCQPGTEDLCQLPVGDVWTTGIHSKLSGARFGAV